MWCRSGICNFGNSWNTTKLRKDVDMRELSLVCIWYRLGYSQWILIHWYWWLNLARLVVHSWGNIALAVQNVRSLGLFWGLKNSVNCCQIPCSFRKSWKIWIVNLVLLSVMNFRETRKRLVNRLRRAEMRILLLAFRIARNCKYLKKCIRQNKKISWPRFKRCKSLAAEMFLFYIYTCRDFVNPDSYQRLYRHIGRR